MSTVSIYAELANSHPEPNGWFYAFSKAQYERGKSSISLGDGERIYRCNGGLFGTKEALNKMFAFYEANRKEIARLCTPQDVYNYEFANHECSFAMDGDKEALEYVYNIWGKTEVYTIKRKCAYHKTDALIAEFSA